MSDDFEREIYIRVLAEELVNTIRESGVVSEEIRTVLGNSLPTREEIRASVQKASQTEPRDVWIKGRLWEYTPERGLQPTAIMEPGFQRMRDYRDMLVASGMSRKKAIRTAAMAEWGDGGLSR
jgi:hypothetical protein